MRFCNSPNGSSNEQKIDTNCLQAVGELLAARARLDYKFGQIKSQASQALLPPSSGDNLGPGTLQGEDLSADQQIDPITVSLEALTIKLRLMEPGLYQTSLVLRKIHNLGLELVHHRSDF